MCISFLQKHPTYKPDINVNLGELLLDFFELYGQKFDYENIGITIRNGGAYLPRKDLPCANDQLLFCIEDTVNIWMNACSESYRASEIKRAFNEAYTILSKAISSSQESENDCKLNSILGRIVYVSNDFLTFRKWVHDKFEHSLLTREMSNSL